MQFSELQWRESNLNSEMVDTILRSWVDTPYALHQCKKGLGVDCVRFGGAAISEIFELVVEFAKLPPDMALHSPKTAWKAMRQFRKQFMPNVVVQDGSITAGDVLVMGYEGGGPGHLMIAGSSTLFHATRNGVKETGLLCPNQMYLARIYRHGSVRLSSSS